MTVVALHPVDWNVVRLARCASQALITVESDACSAIRRTCAIKAYEELVQPARLSDATLEDKQSVSDVQSYRSNE